MKINGKEIIVHLDDICKNCGKRAGDHRYLGGNCPSEDSLNVALVDSFFEKIEE